MSRTSRKSQSKVKPTSEKQLPVVITEDKPQNELISWEDYQKDITNRWKIHNYEVNELRKDISKCVSFTAETYKEYKQRFDNINIGN